MQSRILISNTKKLLLTAMFLALGFLLPLLTSQIKEIGDTLLPMHIPVMLCGFICGWKYGGAIGLTLPLLRSLVFGMPPIYPNAVWMAVELAVYGIVTGIVYTKKCKNELLLIYISLITAMISGRIAWGLVKSTLLGVGGKTFTLTAFIVGGFVDALPGIILQLILIPTILLIINRFLRSDS